jgi:hypothetical protein
LWPAIVENRLTDLLRAGFIPAKNEFNDLFDPGKPLRDFGLKIKVAFLAGLIHKDVADDLRLLAKIRNAFAHRIDIDRFETGPISSWLDSMSSVRVNRELLKKLKEKPDLEKDKEHKTMEFILGNELGDYRNTFHCCIRYLIHHVVGLERKRKAHNEELIESGAWSPKNIGLPE